MYPYAMGQSAIQLEPALEEKLKEEASKRGRAIEEIVGDALRAYFASSSRGAPPGGGAFSSNQEDTAERAEEILRETGFGDD